MLNRVRRRIPADVEARVLRVTAGLALAHSAACGVVAWLGLRDRGTLSLHGWGGVLLWFDAPAALLLAVIDSVSPLSQESAASTAAAIVLSGAALWVVAWCAIRGLLGYLR